jgi:hypothetical protein
MVATISLCDSIFMFVINPVELLRAKSRGRTKGVLVLPEKRYLWTKENHEGTQFRWFPSSAT